MDGPDPEPIVIRDAEVTAAQMMAFEEIAGQPYLSIPWADAPTERVVQLAHVMLRGTDRPLSIEEIKALPGRSIVMDLAASPRVREARAATSDRTQAAITNLLAKLIDEALARLDQSDST